MEILQRTATNIKVKTVANEVINPDTDLFATIHSARKRMIPVAISDGAFETSNGDMAIAQNTLPAAWTWTAVDISDAAEVAAAEKAMYYRFTEVAIVVFASVPK